MPRSSRCCGRWSRSWARTRCAGWLGRPGRSWPAWPPGWAGPRATRTATAPSPACSSCCSACSDGSASRPRLVLVVEDLHWADRSTRELVAFLVRNLRRERLLLVVTYRDDEAGQPPLGASPGEADSRP